MQVTIDPDCKSRQAMQSPYHEAEGTPSKTTKLLKYPPEPCYQPRAWHILVGLLVAALLLIFPGQSAHKWVRTPHEPQQHQQQPQQEQGGSSTSPASFSSRVLDGMRARLGDSPAAAELPPEQQPAELLYSKGSFDGTEPHSCPFDFSQPAPQDDAGRTMTYAECLAANGRPLDEGYDFRWLEAAASQPEDRFQNLMRHVADMWLWSLRRGIGTPCRPQVVTFLCKDERVMCGGVGDRVRGQNIAFWQAVLTHSFFVSQWERPVPLHEYLVPAWRTLEFPDVRACLQPPGNASAQVVQWHRLQFFSRPGVKAHDFVEEWRGADIVESRSNLALFLEFLENPSLQPALQRYRLTRIPLRDMLRIGLQLYAAKPSGYMQRAAQPYLQRLGRPGGVHTVGIHMRVGGDQLEDPARQPLESANCFAAEALAQCSDVAPRPCAAFVAADSTEAIAKVSAKLAEAGVPVVVTEGAITHNDKPHLSALPGRDHYPELVEQAAKTYVDWYLLTQMDSLVMSHSGFSFAAAWASAPATARWMDLARAKEGVCHFQDYASRCRGSRCAGMGFEFHRRDEADDLGSYGPLSSADEAADDAADADGDTQQTIESLGSKGEKAEADANTAASSGRGGAAPERKAVEMEGSSGTDGEGAATGAAAAQSDVSSADAAAEGDAAEGDDQAGEEAATGAYEESAETGAGGSDAASGGGKKGGARAANKQRTAESGRKARADKGAAGRRSHS